MLDFLVVSDDFLQVLVQTFAEKPDADVEEDSDGHYQPGQYVEPLLVGRALVSGCRQDGVVVQIVQQYGSGMKDFQLEALIQRHHAVPEPLAQ